MTIIHSTARKYLFGAGVALIALFFVFMPQTASAGMYYGGYQGTYAANYCCQQQYTHSWDILSQPRYSQSYASASASAQPAYASASAVAYAPTYNSYTTNNYNSYYTSYPTYKSYPSYGYSYNYYYSYGYPSYYGYYY